MSELRPIELTEYQPRRLPPDAISEELEFVLWDRYKEKIDVQAPGLRTEGQWELTSKGWVGYLPLPGQGVVLALHPKVSLQNLFRMLEYAYNLGFYIPEGIAHCRSLDEFYEELANVLSKRILDRVRRGLFRDYVSETDRLFYLRGRLDVRDAVCRPWEPALRCMFQEHTADVDENRILTWTLFCIAQSGRCSERVLPTVRKAYRALLGSSTLAPCTAEDCLQRLYTRLNQDYAPLHALCRFFLEHTGPSHHMGEHRVFPFLIDMAQLFERFVAEWLRNWLPKAWELKAQETVYIGAGQRLSFDIDLAVYDRASREIKFVLDTKYKAPEVGPANADIFQIVTYAKAKECQEAVLVYPTEVAQPIDVTVGEAERIRVRSLTFSLAGNLDAAGEAFLRDLLS